MEVMGIMAIPNVVLAHRAHDTMKTKIIVLIIIILLVLSILVLFFLLKPSSNSNVLNISEKNNMNINLTDKCFQKLGFYSETMTQWCEALNSKNVTSCEKIDHEELVLQCKNLNTIVNAVKNKNPQLCEQVSDFRKDLCKMFIGGDVQSGCDKISSNNTLNMDASSCVSYFNHIMSNEDPANSSENYYFVKAIAKNDEDYCHLAKFYFKNSSENNAFTSEFSCKQLINNSFVYDCTAFLNDICN